MLVSMRFWVSEQGGLVDAADARVSVLDHGFTVADGVFETLKVTDGVAFALTRHLDRLSRSASLMGLPSPDPTIVRSAVEQTIEANAAHLTGLARLRITYTAGVAPLGLGIRGPGDTRPGAEEHPILLDPEGAYRNGQ